MIGRMMGLPNWMVARSVGLDNALADPMLKGRLEGMTGEDAPELVPLGIVMGSGMGIRELPLGVRGPKSNG